MPARLAPIAVHNSALHPPEQQALVADQSVGTSVVDWITYFATGSGKTSGPLWSRPGKGHQPGVAQRARQVLPEACRSHSRLRAPTMTNGRAAIEAYAWAVVSRIAAAWTSPRTACRLCGLSPVRRRCTGRLSSVSEQQAPAAGQTLLRTAVLAAKWSGAPRVCCGRVPPRTMGERLWEVRRGSRASGRRRSCGSVGGRPLVSPKASNLERCAASIAASRFASSRLNYARAEFSSANLKPDAAPCLRYRATGPGPSPQQTTRRASGQPGSSRRSRAQRQPKPSGRVDAASTDQRLIPLGTSR
jgi:hypothetical protein